jgi:hypothetical protein
MGDLELRRTHLLQEIYDAFSGVTRENGVSWRDAQIADFHGDESFADYIDTDSTWQDLVDDEHWVPDQGIGGFSFLDPIGFRYYLPAAMIRSIGSGYDEGVQFHLTVPPRWWTHDAPERFSTLNDAQKTCIRHFVEYMMDAAEQNDPEFGSSEAKRWEKALKRYWNRC